MFIGHADAAVDHLEAGTVAVPPRGKADLAPIGELDGVGQQIDQYLLEPHGVALDPVGQVCRRFHNIGESLELRRFRDQVGGVLDDDGRLKGVMLDLQLAGFNPGGIEDIVDDAQQMFTGVEDAAEGTQTCVLGGVAHADPCHAQHGIQRGADLVAHIGEKHALGLGEVLCRQAGRLQGGAYRKLRAQQILPPPTDSCRQDEQRDDMIRPIGHLASGWAVGLE